MVAPIEKYSEHLLNSREWLQLPVRSFLSSTERVTFRDMTTRTGAGPLLKQWRTRRRFSQLDLATEAGVSQRHLSFLETGRSKPSREMLVHLGEVLDVPLRDRNTMLTAAGFAPAYRERSLEDPEMAPIRAAVELIIERHDPYPAFAIDRHWNVLRSSEATGRMMLRLVDPATAPLEHGLNVMRMTLHPDGLRPWIVNWDEVAGELIDRVNRDAAAYPDDPVMQRLAEEMLSYPDVADHLSDADPDAAPQLVLPVHVKKGDFEVKTFSTLTTIGSPLDITVQELMIEMLFPADEASDETFRQLATEG